MAFITANIKLYSAMRDMRVNLYFPTDLPSEVGNEVKGVVTLLHGMLNAPEDWTWMTAAARYAADNGLVLVAPDAQTSFYHDMQGGAPFYALLTEDLPRELHRIFKLPTQREKNFICGLSMGGYGALRIGLKHPERYAAVGSFSGCLHMQAMLAGARDVPVMGPVFTGIFGEGLHLPEEESLPALATAAAARPQNERPRLFLTCGLQDNQPPVDILGQNRWFAQQAMDLPMEVEYNERDGVHEWNFWDRSLAEFIGFALRNDYGERKKKDWQ